MQAVPLWKGVSRSSTSTRAAEGEQRSFLSDLLVLFVHTKSTPPSPPRRGANQEEVAHHGPGLVGHFSGLLVVDGEAGDIGGHHVGGELHPGELEVSSLSDLLVLFVHTKSTPPPRRGANLYDR